MKIKFYWYFDSVEKHKLKPAVEIKCVVEKTINCLHGVLTDDAGINSNAWLEKGMKYLRKLKIDVIPKYGIVVLGGVNIMMVELSYMYSMTMNTIFIYL